MCVPGRVSPAVTYWVPSPMITSMKSTHESVPFKDGVVRLYSYFVLNSIGGVNMRKNGISAMITSMKSAHGNIPFKDGMVRL